MPNILSSPIAIALIPLTSELVLNRAFRRCILLPLPSVVSELQLIEVKCVAKQ